MTPSFASPLRRVAISTFEALALLLTEAEPASQDAAAPLTHAVRVAFAGPRGGFVELRTGHAVAVAAARNMLAEADPTPALCADALAEIANVICGNFVPALASPDDVYHLDAPRAVAPAPAPDADACVDLVVEGGPVQVRLVLAVELARPAA
jgi:Chemotaxis phosphatase CheX